MTAACLTCRVPVQLGTAESTRGTCDTCRVAELEAALGSVSTLLAVAEMERAHLIGSMRDCYLYAERRVQAIREGRS